MLFISVDVVANDHHTGKEIRKIVVDGVLATHNVSRASSRSLADARAIVVLIPA